MNLKKDKESIQVNGVFTRQNYILSCGDELTVCIREQESSAKIIPVKLPLSIVYEDEDLLVINKPAGMPIHPSRNNFDNSLGNALAHYYKEKGQPFVFRCINRLDRDTSGLTIVAKHMVSASVLSRMVQKKPEDVQSKGIIREYLAIVDGILDPPAGIISAPIARKESRCLMRVVDFEKGVKAVTRYQVIAKKENQSLVSLRLFTGRTHQIRVHMQYIGHPLLGDFLYHPLYRCNQTDRLEEGADTGQKPEGLLIGRQALHAHRLSFSHPMTGEHLEFRVPLPDDMEQLWRN